VPDQLRVDGAGDVDVADLRSRLARLAARGCAADVVGDDLDLGLDGVRDTVDGGRRLLGRRDVRVDLLDLLVGHRPEPFLVALGEAGGDGARLLAAGGAAGGVDAGEHGEGDDREDRRGHDHLDEGEAGFRPVSARVVHRVLHRSLRRCG
jgi:hypothetical protein